MSKDTNNLRLLGSPVNLSYRGKKNNDRKNIRNRPRSALQNSCFTPDNKERYKRPFSADAKASSSTRSFFNNFNSEVTQAYPASHKPIQTPYPYPSLPPGKVRRASIHSGYPITTVKVVAPTAALLAERPSAKNKDICSNASDYGSEDTYISLGTKIKAKAQSGQKLKEQNKSFKFRNIPKKGRKHMEGSNEDKPLNQYGLEVKITERQQTPTRRDSSRSPSPNFRRAYESYFIQLEAPREQDIAGRVSFGNSKIDQEVEQAIDTYSRRLTLTKQQLSLVEEEPQEAESPSQHATQHDMSSLSPEEPMEDSKNVNVDTGRHTYVVENERHENLTPKQNHDQRTYRSFYDDFQSSSFDQYKTKTSSSMEPTDASSKDSGYPDSGHNDEKAYQKIYSFTGPSLKKSNSHNRVEDQPKSLDSLRAKGNDKDYHKTFPLDRKSQWAEPLNHSRLLYKDFFLKKEGHTMPPQNSPTTTNNNSTNNNIVVENIPDVVAVENTAEEANENNLEYPSYLRNSTTKAYTSKVIEDYKKELEAINNLHELTLKDIKTDAISPTPLNIDRMFEQHSSFSESKDDSANIAETSNVNNKNALDLTKADVSKVSTKELIQNYLKVKESVNHMNNKDNGAKSFKKMEKKTNNVSKSEVNVSPYRNDEWNNRPKASCTQIPKSVNIKGQTQKTPFTLRPPMSARIGGVQNDKDVESWMSLSSPPRIDKDTINHFDKITEIECPIDSTLLNTQSIEQRPSSPPPAAMSSLQTTSTEKDTIKKKELDSAATVFDIYSMLKEIESYGDNPVTAVTENALPEVESKKETDKEEADPTPKDNFMEIFDFLEKVEKSANDALSVVTTSAPTTTPKLEVLLKLPPTELAQRLITASLQLEERSCCIALLQESLANHKEQMMNKVSNLEKQSIRNITKVKLECEEAVKRHQAFIDQLINDKKTLNHRIEQLVDERRSLEERWKRSAQALEERYKLELRNQHDKMVASQQVARQRWVRQKAEKIKELTVKGLEGELRQMAERQQKEISDLEMFHAENIGRMQSKHAAELEALRRNLEEEKETTLIRERQLAASRMEKQMLELEVMYQEQRTRLVADIRAENERVAADLNEQGRQQREDFEKWKEEQEKMILDKRIQIEQDLTRQREEMEENMKQKEKELQEKFQQFKKDFEAEQQLTLKRKVMDISTQHKLERDREIEKAIESMEAEAQAGRKELQEAIRRNKEQYEAELRELAETEKATLRRYQEAQARIRQTEDKCAELEVTISQLETRNKIITEKNIQLEKQSEDLRSHLEHCWQDKVNALQKEIEDIKKVHEEQMHQLYAKVKVAVARKDSAIQALTRESAKYQEKITILEQKLQQQRKDFLKHK